MNSKALFSSGEFARLSRTTRAALHLYDDIGLLTPFARGENNYRYYSSSQLAIINVIRILQELGMTLQEIKEIKEQRTPEHANAVFLEQIGAIDHKIQEWANTRKLLFTLQKSIQDVLDIDENKIIIDHFPAKAIMLGDLNDYSKGRGSYDALLSFYKDMHEKFPHLNLNYPVWGLMSKERLEKSDWIWPDRYYFFNPEGHDKRPAGLYATGYARGGYGATEGLYQRMINYINENGYKISGPGYEEYPLNETSVSNSNNYLIRIMITVEATR